MERTHDEEWHLPRSHHLSAAASKHSIDTQLPLRWISFILTPPHHTDLMTLSWQGAKFRRELHSLSHFPNPSFVLAPHCLSSVWEDKMVPSKHLLMIVSFALDCELLLHTGNNGTEATRLFKSYHTVRTRELGIVFPGLICMCPVRAISQHSGK